MLLQAIIVSILGGIICLDRLILQAMISRPIVCAPLIGFAFGEPYTGLVIGVFLELLWADRLPIGAYIPPNDSLTAIVTTSASITAGHTLGQVNPEMVALSILLFVPLGLLAQKIDFWIIRFNDRYSREAERAAEKGNMRGITRNHLQALARAVAINILLIFCSFLMGVFLLISLYPRLPAFTMRALTIIYFCLPVIGIAAALNTINHRRMLPVFCAVFFVATLFWEFLYGV